MLIDTDIPRPFTTLLFDGASFTTEVDGVITLKTARLHAVFSDLNTMFNITFLFAPESGVIAKVKGLVSAPKKYSLPGKVTVKPYSEWSDAIEVNGSPIFFFEDLSDSVILDYVKSINTHLFSGDINVISSVMSRFRGESFGRIPIRPRIKHTSMSRFRNKFFG